MQSIRFIRIALMVIALVFTVNAAISEVTVDPTGIAVWLDEADDVVELEMTLSNSGEEDVAYRLRYFNVDREENERFGGNVGPRRDEPGETLDEVELEHAGILGMGFDHENGVMWVTHLNQAEPPGYITGYEWNGAEITEVVNDFEVSQWILGGTYYDGVIYSGIWPNSFVTMFSTEGENLGNVEYNGSYVMSCAVDQEMGYLYIISFQTVNIHVLDINDDFNEVGVIECVNVQDGDAADFRGRITWVPEHEDGHLWLGHTFVVEDGLGQAWQIAIDEDWNWDVVQSFDVETDVRSPGIAHDGVNLWIGNEHEAMARIIDDGIAEPNWFMADPMQGEIGANEDAAIAIEITPGEIEEGLWEMLLRIDIREAEGERDDFEATSIEMAVVLSYNTPVVQLSGHVTAADDEVDSPIAQIGMDYFMMTRTTDEEGLYEFSNLPLGDYIFNFSAPDFLPTEVEVSWDEGGEVELNVELFHAECIPDNYEITLQLEPDMEREIRFDVTNEGNGPLTYTVERRLRGGADAEPWDIRLEENIEEPLEDDMLAGAVFLDDYFYISGGNNGHNPNKIYILNMDREVVDEFDQFADNRYGMRDLAYDGALIWGAIEGTFYGFTTDGNLDKTFEFIPVNGFEGRSCAWDSEDSLLWVTDLSTDIYGINTDGELVRTIENNDLRIRGLGYWPDDPDGYNLYVFCRGPDDIGITVYKLNLANGDYMEVIYLDIGESRPSSLQITNQLDVYSWVIVGLVQNPDLLYVWQLATNYNWFSVAPNVGVIEADNSEEFTLTLNTDGLPPDNTFEGELVFIHDGIDGETVVSVILEVQLGRVETERTIQLRMGWNLVSVNLQPNNEEDIEGLLAPLVDEDLLIFMKNSAGEFYRPEYDFNNIPGWYVNEGYYLLVSGNTHLTLEGVTVLRDDPIDLTQGWQAVSYYPNFEIEATVALSGIANNLVIAKDGSGNFYLPAWDHFSNMGDMCPGQGYWINVDDTTTLVYQMGEENNALFENLVSKPGFLPSHPNTSENMSLLMKCDPAMKGEIGVYAGDLIVGSGVLNGGMVGLALWGDDKTTDTVDGALDGDLLEIRYYSEALQLNVEYTVLAGEMIYRKDTFAVIDLAAVSELPSEFGIISVYPNPFNAQTRITYSLPEASLVDLAIFDLNGRRINQLTGSRMSAGMHTVSFNGTGIPSGIYFIRLNAGQQKSEWKVALVK
ncbi:MAG: T9SS type A sorting domain-containing protein, partial [Calditrichaeota bacterium]|nr:T9SS type A sorting domain-containing protein [Calditrichota bacterium]